jgi:transposase-like protein
MKNSGKCPKCQSNDVVRIAGGTGTSGNIFMGTFSGIVLLTRYLCASCGFVEQWVESADDIAKVKRKYESAPE